MYLSRNSNAIQTCGSNLRVTDTYTPGVVDRSRLAAVWLSFVNLAGSNLSRLCTRWSRTGVLARKRDRSMYVHTYARGCLLQKVVGRVGFSWACENDRGMGETGRAERRHAPLQHCTRPQQVPPICLWYTIINNTAVVCIMCRGEAAGSAGAYAGLLQSTRRIMMLRSRRRCSFP